MKKSIFAILAAVALCSTANAGFDIIGQVSAKTPNTITVQVASQQYVVGVTPMTKVEAETRWDFDYRISFESIKIGEWVKIDAYPVGQGQYYAEDIEVMR